MLRKAGVFRLGLIAMLVGLPLAARAQDTPKQPQEPQFSVTGQIEDLGPSIAGRVTATPLRPLAGTFESLRVGVAYLNAQLPEGLNSLRGQTVYGTEDFFEPVYVEGRRTRMGVEVSYFPGRSASTATSTVGYGPPSMQYMRNWKTLRERRYLGRRISGLVWRGCR
jgi:hypothetical protein